ncbi:hypothetical protein IV203_009244 [Nitzschia inconspicua]|uniref:Uncharacterized protein n=1 Tax=Nitzschia inconspicua TaxID=303405 RepID=A0A9K3L0B5_9STRA|nr:hypothetical protein IV203_011051 [Nitzschia inconspicua]KAG7353195.1 hypothetical protein IV203_009244 [Nitzschia inconspicua]
MSGVKHLSSKVVTSKCILGEQFQDQFIDTLPFPPVENPRNMEECFDKSKYSNAQKENGRRILFQTLTDFLKTSYGVLFMDTNKLILDDDPNCRRSAHDILTEDFQLIYTERFLDGEIVLYLDERQFHTVLLHKPVCVASDSRRFISDSLRWKRGITVSTLCNVGRLVRGEPVLSPNVRFCNPIHAMLAFHIVLHGYHLGHRQAAAFYRDFVTPESTNAVLDNGLPKSAENDPVAERLRRKYIQASGRIFVDKMDHGEKVRRQDCSIISQGRSITSQAQIESTDWDVVMQLKTLFRANPNPSLQSANFRHFVQNHLSDQWSKQLLEVYETTTANAGNRTMGPNKAATRVKVNFNDGSVAQLLQTHASQNGELQGERFWIKKTQNVVAHPATGSISTDPSISFPNDKMIYDDLCYDGLRERFKRRVRQNSGHDAVKAIRYEQFVLKKCTKRNIGCRNPYTVSCGGYVLVYIEARPSKEPVLEFDTTASSAAVPLERHCTQRSKIPRWTRAKECVVCIVKAEEQYPDWSNRCKRALPCLYYIVDIPNEIA